MSDSPDVPPATVEADLAAVTGIRDRALLVQLRELGFSRDTVVLLFLAPLAQVAWAEGAVTPREREALTARAGRAGILPGTRAFRTLTSWLDVRPSDGFFSGCLDAIRAIATRLPGEEQATIVRDLLSSSRAVAGASGGLLGFGAVSGEEKALLARIAAELAGS